MLQYAAYFVAKKRRLRGYFAAALLHIAALDMLCSQL